MAAEANISEPVALACPGCGVPLTSGAASLACHGCGRAWPLRQGVACLGQSDDFPLAFEPIKMAELLAVAERSGWQVALHDHMRLLDPKAYRHAADEYRAQWQCLLPLSPQGCVLDLRCGWGAVATSLAPNVARLVAADVRYELARFTALRADSLGLANVSAVSLDPAQRLPFADGAFDGIIIQDVLEWASPAALLSEAARLLAPQGWVFVNLRNRLDLGRLLLGGQRAGSGLRANPLTLRGCRRALAAAGLPRQAAYGLLPSVSEPFYIVGLTHASALRYFLDGLFESAGLRLALAKRNLLGPFQAAQALWRAGRFLPVEHVAQHLLPGYGLLARRARG
jgi:SAM-dependent methyltransferase